jgi:hypothetical protein
MNNDKPAQTTDETSEVVRRFNEVFQRHDPSALPELVAKDCVIENTQPAPNGSGLGGGSSRLAARSAGYELRFGRAERQVSV